MGYEKWNILYLKLYFNTSNNWDAYIDETRKLLMLIACCFWIGRGFVWGKISFRTNLIITRQGNIESFKEDRGKYSVKSVRSHIILDRVRNVTVDDLCIEMFYLKISRQQGYIISLSWVNEQSLGWVFATWSFSKPLLLSPPHC